MARAFKCTADTIRDDRTAPGPGTKPQLGPAEAISAFRAAKSRGSDASPLTSRIGGASQFVAQPACLAARGRLACPVTRRGMCMRGYFGIGVEGISKPMNLGAVLRTAHAFNAAFAFAIQPMLDVRAILRSDTSIAIEAMPVHIYDCLEDFSLPVGCRLVGVEITPEAIELPSFTHPHTAAYVLGAEQDSLSPKLVKKCEFVIRIPTRFCVNLSIAAAIVMYDRMVSLGRFAERPVRVGGPKARARAHVQGLPKWKRRLNERSSGR